ncbi:MAG: alpha/beta hydrolase [Bacteroidetes bacterium]|nr:MAG: alpha/beta hydrolase [Bacteroidota bacterium]
MEIKVKGDFEYIDEGQGEVLLLLHGLFGMLSNWEGVINKFSSKMRIVIPLLPIYDMPLRQSGLEGLTAYVERFVDLMNLENMSVMGNSLGGHIGLMYTLNNEDKVKNLILTGSSGLFENSMGGSYPKRGDYNYIKERVGYTFYDPTTVGDEYVDELFEILKSIPKTLRIVAIAKSAQRNNMATDIVNIKVPTLLIWGLNDTITPPAVAHEFNKLIPNSTLRFIDKCCHAPMMERPDEYNVILENYLMSQE